MHAVAVLAVDSCHIFRVCFKLQSDAKSKSTIGSLVNTFQEFIEPERNRLEYISV